MAESCVNRNLILLRLKHFGNTANPDKKNITNLSDYKLSSTEEYVFSHGLYFCLPPTNLKREEIFAEFEVLFAQLHHHRPCSVEKHSALNAKLSDFALCGTWLRLSCYKDRSRRLFNALRMSQRK